MKRIEITTEDFNNLKLGTIFMIPCWDSDDFHEWEFKYIKSLKGFIYLGGGLDNGSAIGKTCSVEDLLEEVNNSDFPKITEYKLTRTN